MEKLRRRYLVRVTIGYVGIVLLALAGCMRVSADSYETGETRFLRLVGMTNYIEKLKTCETIGFLPMATEKMRWTTWGSSDGTAPFAWIRKVEDSGIRALTPEDIVKKCGRPDKAISELKTRDCRMSVWGHAGYLTMDGKTLDAVIIYRFLSDRDTFFKSVESKTNDVRWARICLSEHMIPTSGMISLLSAYANTSDDATVEIPAETFMGEPPVGLRQIIKKYGAASASKPANSKIGKVQERSVVHNWYGAIAFVTESDGDTIGGMAVRGDLLKEIIKERDFRKVAEAYLEKKE